MEKSINRKLLYCSFGIYAFLLVWIIALKFNADWLSEVGEYLRKMPLQDRVGKNIIPFYKMFKEGISFNKDYFYNVVIYIPLGIYLPLLLKNKPKYITYIIIIATSSIIFELIQLVTGFGGYDGSDIVCNANGGIIGLILYYFLISKWPNKVINIINIIAIIVFAPVAVYALINTILNIHLYYIPL